MKRTTEDVNFSAAKNRFFIEITHFSVFARFAKGNF
jgi:hypothetical protein